MSNKWIGLVLALFGCVGVAIAVAVGTDADAEADVATVMVGGKTAGKFASAGGAFDAVGVYAWTDGVGFFGDKPGVRVAIANAPLDAAAIDAASDRRKAIRQTDVPGVRVVFLMFGKDGSWYGYSGNGCGYCYQSKVDSSVRLAKGRIAGRVKYAGKSDDAESPPFELWFNAPVAPAIGPAHE